MTERAKYKIEKNIPQPAPRKSIVKGRYPFAEMSVGDSFFIPIEKGDTIRGMSNRVSVAAFTYGKLHKKKFSQRQHKNEKTGEPEGLRVWRLK